MLLQQGKLTTIVDAVMCRPKSWITNEVCISLIVVVLSANKSPFSPSQKFSSEDRSFPAQDYTALQWVSGRHIQW